MLLHFLIFFIAFIVNFMNIATNPHRFNNNNSDFDRMFAHNPKNPSNNDRNFHQNKRNLNNPNRLVNLRKIQNDLDRLGQLFLENLSGDSYTSTNQRGDRLEKRRKAQEPCEYCPKTPTRNDDFLVKYYKHSPAIGELLKRPENHITLKLGPDNLIERPAERLPMKYSYIGFISPETSKIPETNLNLISISNNSEYSDSYEPFSVVRYRRNYGKNKGDHINDNLLSQLPILYVDTSHQKSKIIKKNAVTKLNNDNNKHLQDANLLIKSLKLDIEKNSNEIKRKTNNKEQPIPNAYHFDLVRNADTTDHKLSSSTETITEKNAHKSLNEELLLMKSFSSTIPSLTFNYKDIEKLVPPPENLVTVDDNPDLTSKNEIEKLPSSLVPYDYEDDKEINILDALISLTTKATNQTDIINEIFTTEIPTDGNSTIENVEKRDLQAIENLEKELKLIDEVQNILDGINDDSYQKESLELDNNNESKQISKRFLFKSKKSKKKKDKKKKGFWRRIFGSPNNFLDKTQQNSH